MNQISERLSKPSIKSFLTFWKPSLGRRLTFSFTIFGILVGYVVFIYFTISSTNTLIKLASETVRHYVSSAFQGYSSSNQGELLKTINQRIYNIANASAPIRNLFFSPKAELYFQNNGIWHHTYEDKHGTIKSQTITDQTLIQSLEKVRSSRLTTSSKFFYGAGDIVNVKINISPATENYSQIISLDIYRTGLIKMIRKNLYKSLLFFFVLFLLSHSLGHCFSIWLAQPIEKLAQEAQVIAAGNYERRFSTERQDEIGKLAAALNTMAGRIIDETRERENLLIGILIALTKAIDAKSPWTAGHSERVTHLAIAIGRTLKFREDQMRNLMISAILHDIGKIAVPESILDKPGKLTEEEYALVKKHSETGADIIASIPSYQTILPGILHHHERWDGSGYPRGLKGEDIPWFARIICIADVYDALSEDRPYRKAWNKKQIINFLKNKKARCLMRN